MYAIKHTYVFEAKHCCGFGVFFGIMSHIHSGKSSKQYKNLLLSLV